MQDKRLKLLFTENEIDYLLYTPSIKNLYYPEQAGRIEPPHRYSLGHKLKMIRYICMGGYRILYLRKNGLVVSYIVFTRSNNRIIRGTRKSDYYTVYLWTYPEYRGQGLGTSMAEAMLNKIGLEYRAFYKTIDKSNSSSIRVAEKSGFVKFSESIRRGIFKKIYPIPTDGTQYIYKFEKIEK